MSISLASSSQWHCLCLLTLGTMLGPFVDSTIHRGEETKGTVHRCGHKLVSQLFDPVLEPDSSHFKSLQEFIFVRSPLLLRSGHQENQPREARQNIQHDKPAQRERGRDTYDFRGEAVSHDDGSLSLSNSLRSIACEWGLRAIQCASLARQIRTDSSYSRCGSNGTYLSVQLSRDYFLLHHPSVVANP